MFPLLRACVWGLEEAGVLFVRWCVESESELLLDMMTRIRGWDFQPRLCGIGRERDCEGVGREKNGSLFWSSG